MTRNTPLLKGAGYKPQHTSTSSPPSQQTLVPRMGKTTTAMLCPDKARKERHKGEKESKERVHSYHIGSAMWMDQHTKEKGTCNL